MMTMTKIYSLDKNNWKKKHDWMMWLRDILKKIELRKVWLRVTSHMKGMCGRQQINLF